MTSVSVALILDVSGSMAGSKLANAQTDASTFVNLMHTDDYVGVVKFSDNATIIYPTNAASNLVQITGLPIQNAAVSAIMGTKSLNMTNIKDAITKAFGMFPSSPTNSGMVLLSDGYWNVGGNPIPVSETTVPIYTIGLMVGTKTSAVLQTIATSTKGKYHYSADAWDLAEIYNDIAQSSSLGNLTINNKESIPQMNFKTYPTTISSGNTHAKFAVNWTNQSVAYTSDTPKTNQINVSLKDPDGNTVTPTTIAPGKGFVVLTVNNPKAGSWTIGSWTGGTGTLDTTVAAIEPNATSMDLRITSSNLKTGESIPFIAKVHNNGNAIDGVKINATVESPLVSVSNDEDDELKALQVPLPRKIFPITTNEKESGEHHGEILADTEGSHTIRVTAHGISPIDSSPFARTARLSVNVVNS